MAVEVEQRQDIRVIRMARPPVNAINLQYVLDLGEAVRAAADDPDCRGVVLTGLPGVFSAGFDIKEAARMSSSEMDDMYREINRMVLALYGLAKPLVTAVSGHAFGGGLILALTGDLRLAAAVEDGKIGLTEAAAGVRFPAGPLAIVRAELSPEVARYLILGSEPHPLDAPVAARLFDETVDAGALLERGVEIARTLAGHPQYGAVKRQLRGPVIERLECIVRE